MRLTALAAILLLGACGPASGRAAPQPPRLALPVACEIGRTCELQSYVDRDPGPGARDYRCGGRTYDGHNGIDVRVLDLKAQQNGVEVLAAAPGKVLRLRDGVADISIRAIGAPDVAGQECGNGVVIDHGDGWTTQYCHLSRGSLRVKPGDAVAAGQPIGRVGLSGNTEFPHLHMTVRQGRQVVDPFAPSGDAASCEPHGSLWEAATARQLRYKAGAILNAGFAGAPVTLAAIETGELAPVTTSAQALVAYMRAIGLEKGDELELVLTGPGGAQLLTHRLPPLDRDKAQFFAMAGRKRPPAGWPSGRYEADLRVHRDGKPVLQRRVAITL